MAWSTSYDNSKILTIGEMNQSKSYKIFPGITSSSADWNRCPIEVTASFFVPSDVTIRSITVELFNDAEAYCTYNLSSSQLNKDVSIGFTGSGSLSEHNTDYY